MQLLCKMNRGAGVCGRDIRVDSGALREMCT